MPRSNTNLNPNPILAPILTLTHRGSMVYIPFLILYAQAGAITMHAGLGVKYHDVDDATTVAAFEALGLLSWIAKGNVEMLKWFREGRGQDVASDVLAITGKAPTKVDIIYFRDVVGSVYVYLHIQYIFYLLPAVPFYFPISDTSVIAL